MSPEGPRLRFGAVWGTLAALRRMRPRRRGTIVQDRLRAAYRSIPLQAPYAAPRPRCAVLPTRCGANSRTTAARSTSPWCSCRRQHAAVRLGPHHLRGDRARWAAPRRKSPRRPCLGGHAPTARGQGRRPGGPGHRRHPALPRRPRPPARPHSFDGQHTNEPLPPDRADNLYAPVAGDHGAHGRFDAEAHGYSAQWWADRHRAALIAVASVVWCLGRLSNRARPRGRVHGSRTGALIARGMLLPGRQRLYHRCGRGRFTGCVEKAVDNRVGCATAPASARVAASCLFREQRDSAE